VAVNARPGSETEALALAEGFSVLHDAPGDPDGPLAGVRAGLAWAASRGSRALAVSPCDAPLLPEDVFSRLVEAAGAGAAMAATVEGPEALCAVWPVDAQPALALTLAGGAHPPTWRVLQDIGARTVLFEPPEAFASVNTREDLALAAARLKARRAFRGGPGVLP
jgi:molybdopterin-guanine dinucleotide biosynthesis protein A